MTTTETDWKPSACILCECNCGVEIRLGADGRTFERVRGDKAHPASQGYTCEKALRLDYYQNGRGERVLHPLRRRPDGTFEEIDWDTAIREVAARLGEVRDTYGGETIVYYGGGGQGNHLGGTYSSATLNAFGARFRSSAIAQEKTGEAWVNGLMLGTPGARRVRALRGRAVRRQEPLVEPRHPPRPHDAQGDRQRPGPLDGRHRPAAHGDGRARRLPPPGAPRSRRLAARRPGRRARRRVAARSGLPRRPDVRPGAGHGGPAGGPDRRVLPDLRCRRGPRAGRRPAHRHGLQRRRVRGPRRADEPPLDARQLPREAGLAADRQPRPPGRPVLADVAGQPRAHQPARARPGDGAPQPGRRRPHHQRADPVQRDPRRDPHRPPAALPGDDRRVRQPGPLDRRQPADAPGDRAARRRRVHRRVHDRDGPPRRLRAAGDDAVREVRGDVLQLRVPAQRVPPAPAGRRAAGRAAARAGDPRPARRGRRAPHGRATSPRCEPPPSRAGRSSPPPSPRRRAPTRGSGRSPPSCSTARSGRRCPTAPRAPPRCGRSPSAAR